MTRPAARATSSEPSRTATAIAVGIISFANSIGSGLLWSGVPFVAKHDFDFSPRANLALSTAAAIVYIGAALLGGKLTQRLSARVPMRTLLAGVLVVELLAPFLALGGAPSLIACALLTSAVGATLWPIVESYVAAGSHGPAMRKALGRFNVIWMSAVAASMFLISPLQAGASSRLALLALVPAAAISLAMLAWLPKWPPPHAEEMASAHVPPVYEALRATTRVLMPVAYLFAGAVGPLVPYVVDRLHVEPVAQTPVAAIWLIARCAAAAVLPHLSIWHGRFGALALGAALIALGFAGTLAAPTVLVLVCALVAFGIGQGVVYAASLYYAMAVGRAGITAGGAFEALVGIGYFAGAASGLIGSAFGDVAATITCVWVAAALAAVPALRPWWRSREVRDEAAR
jgi:MFS family permease